MTIEDLMKLTDRLNGVLVAMKDLSRIHMISITKNEYNADKAQIILLHRTIGNVISTTIEHLNSLDDYRLYEFLTAPSVDSSTGQPGDADF